MAESEERIKVNMRCTSCKQKIDAHIPAEHRTSQQLQCIYCHKETLIFIDQGTYTPTPKDCA